MDPNDPTSSKSTKTTTTATNSNDNPTLPRPGQQTSQWIPPRVGNPDLDPACLQQGQRIDLREPNPLIPQGMIYDPRQLLDQQRGSRQPESGGRGGLPLGARFDPFGPPDPSLVGPGRGPLPDTQFANPDPDHFAPPGIPQIPRNAQKASKDLFRGPAGSHFPPPGGAGGSPFL